MLPVNAHKLIMKNSWLYLNGDGFLIRLSISTNFLKIEPLKNVKTLSIVLEFKI